MTQPAHGRHRAPRPPRRRRQAVLAGVAAVTIAMAMVAVARLDAGGASGVRSPNATPTFVPVHLPSLRVIAHERGIQIGVGTRAELLANPVFAGGIARIFTSLTEKNAFKWMPTEPYRGTFNFRLTDGLVQYAAAHNMRLRGSTLVWYRQNPAWLLRTPWTKGALRQVLHRHISTLVGRYRGRVPQWDVVNEPFEDNPVRLRATVFSDTLGPRYIDDAFRWAHAADPSAELVLNDYNNDRPGAHFLAEYRLLRGMLARGVPVDAVGLEMHHTVDDVPSPHDLAKVIRAFAGLGLEVEITEMGIALPLPPTRADLTRQAVLYRQVAAVCTAIRACTGLTVWGADDRDPDDVFAFRGLGAGTLFARSARPKLAYNGVAQGLAFTPGRPNRLPFPTPTP